MSSVVSLKTRAWARPLGGKRLKAGHPPSRLSELWFRRNGPLRAHVDLQGALVLEHDKPIPASIMADLAKSQIVYIDGLAKPVKELPGRQFLVQWLKWGAGSETLVFHRPEGLSAPLGATALCLIVREGGTTQEICWVPYYPDERLIQQLHPAQTTGGHTT